MFLKYKLALPQGIKQAFCFSIRNLQRVRIFFLFFLYFYYVTKHLIETNQNELNYLKDDLCN